MSIIFAGDNAADVCLNLRRLIGDIERIQATIAPTAFDLERAPLLNGWSFAVRPASCLIGSVSAHPVLGNRRHTRTSELFAIDTQCGWARTWSRFYRLGVPEREFSGAGDA